MLTSNPKLSLTVLALILVPACGGPEPKMTPAKTEDGVPANSAAEDRLSGEARIKAAAAKGEDPSQPYTTPVNGGGDNGAAASNAGTGANAAGKGAAGKGTKATAPLAKGGKGESTATATSAVTAAGGGTAKISKAECKQLFNKYIDVAIGSDSRFEGIPPEMINSLKEQALSQAQAQKGDPCSGNKDVTRAQYNCAMASTSTGAWESCLK